jgi:hypothetical protein
VSKEGRYFVVPSKSHKKNSNKYKNKQLTFSDLMNEFYDEELNTHVNQFKHFTFNDKLNFKDKIASIRFNRTENETHFGFRDNSENIIEWPFLGDLTSKYSIGDELELKFTVVDETSEKSIFETLDYIKYGIDNDGNPPDISSFLP